MNIIQSHLDPVRAIATIPSGQSMSNVVDLEAQLVTGFRVPASAGWTSASLTFMVSADGGKTFADLYKDGSEYTLSIPTGRNNAGFFDVLPQDFAGFTHLRIRSGTSATPVNQGAARELQVGRVAI